MKQIQTGQTVTTPRGLLTLQAPVLRGQDGQLWQARLDAVSNEVSCRYLVYLPMPHAEADFLERVRQLSTIASSGWVVPDAVVQEGSLGHLVVYRFERESSLAEAISQGELDTKEAALAFCTRLCAGLANLHALGLHHGMVVEKLIHVSPGCNPQIIDAPIGPPLGSDVLQKNEGEVTGSLGDIRCTAGLIGRLLARLQEMSGEQTPRLSPEIERILSRAKAAGARNGYVQICELRDDLIALARPRRFSARTMSLAAAAGVLVVAAVSLVSGVGVGRQSGLQALRDTERELAAAVVRVSGAETRLAELEKQAEIHRSMVKAIRDDLVFGSNGQSLGSNTLAAWSSLEMLLWPLSGEDAVSVERRRSFLEDRLTVARRFVDDSYARGNERHIETMLAELSISVWEAQAGRFDHARVYLDRVVPRLEDSLATSDPLLRGARQLAAFVVNEQVRRDTTPRNDLEPWVRNMIGVHMPEDHSASAGVMGIAEAFQVPSRIGRNLAFTRQVSAHRKGLEPSVPTP